MDARYRTRRGCPCDEPPCKEWRVPGAGTAYRHETLWMDAQPGKMELRELLTVLLNKRSRAGEPFVFYRQRALDPYHSERGGCFRWGFAPLLPFIPDAPVAPADAAAPVATAL